MYLFKVSNVCISLIFPKSLAFIYFSLWVRAMCYSYVAFRIIELGQQNCRAAVAPHNVYSKHLAERRTQHWVPSADGEHGAGHSFPAPLSSPLQAVLLLFTCSPLMSPNWWNSEKWGLFLYIVINSNVILQFTTGFVCIIQPVSSKYWAQVLGEMCSRPGSGNTMILF